MKLVEMKCKNCGAKLKVEPDDKEAKCQFCGAEFKIDDEVHHHKLDDAEQTGYELEKGKIRAREEAKQEKMREQNAMLQAQYEEEKRKKNLKWWIIGWIFCFPIPLTILIWKSKWNQKKKIIATVILWAVLLIIGALTPDGTATTQNTTNTNDNKVQTDVKVNELFIERYNSMGTQKIENLKSYNAQDTKSDYYRTEFRTGIFENNTSIHGSIGNIPVDLINYGFDEKDEFRFYASTENEEQMKTIFKNTINILDNKVSNDNVNNIINNAIQTKDTRLTLDGNIKNGYIIFMKDKWEIFIESNIDFINQKETKTKSSKSNEKNNNDTYMDALRKCTVMEASDIYTTGVGKKSDNVFNDAKTTCERFKNTLGEKDFIETVTEDWKNRQNEQIEGKTLSYYLDQLGW